ncbi:MAG TPA: hypothetical protein VHQ98_13075 [Gaiellaceae bacterium]|jgi:hypothetical protein|nr:hypothetical protein [Gaiellaceae bacterium]
MRALRTAGECLGFDCSLDWVAELIDEGSERELRDVDPSAVSVNVCVESARCAFDIRGWNPLGRGAWQRNGVTVLENACASGFDLRLTCSSNGADLTYRWRPPARDRAAALALRSRFHLLARAVLMQYPALWWAGVRGRAPLHASAWTNGDSTPLVTAPSGIGRSTLLGHELELGSHATGDNLAVGDGTTLWGLIEPMRVENGSGRRMPHGRREADMTGRVEALVPDAVVVLERGSDDHPSLRRCSSAKAERALVTSTYMAAELRRYWAFAATLAAGTGVGPAHPPVTEVAFAFVTGRPSFSLALGTSPGACLSRLLTAPGVAECA